MTYESIVPASVTESTTAGSTMAKEAIGAIIRTGAAITGLQSRDNPPESPEERIRGELLNLELVDSLRAGLQPRLQVTGFRVERGVAAHPYGKPDYAYSALR